MKFLFTTASALLVLLTGCRTSTGTLSREPIGYFQISNATDGLTAVVDDMAPVALVPERAKATLQVAPGKHRLKIMRGQAVLVDRAILVSDLQTVEILVP